MKKVGIFLIFTALYATAIASAEMDWGNMTIKAAATNQTTAFDMVKNELYSLQYDDTKTVGDFLKNNPDLENRLNRLLFENQLVKQNYLTDGSIEYTSQLPLINKVISLLLPDTKPVKLVVPMLCPCCGQEWPAGKPIPEGLELVPKQSETTEYTGIIIDCRSFQITPALFPKIYTELMEEVYSINFADPAYVVNNGLVLYSTKDLYNNPRVGYNPLRIKSVGVTGTKMTYIKISSFDARRIHGSKKNIELLKECRVAIIIGP